MTSVRSSPSAEEILALPPLGDHPTENPHQVIHLKGFTSYAHKQTGVSIGAAPDACSLRTSSWISWSRLDYSFLGGSMDSQISPTRIPDTEMTKESISLVRSAASEESIQ